jgi:hypothetical protein
MRRDAGDTFLVLLLITAAVFIVAAFTLPGLWYRKARSAPACLANLKQLDGAIKTWALEQGKGTNGVPVDADLFGTNAYLKAKPQCPAGGTYTLGPVGRLPTCSIPRHNKSR